MNDSTLPEQRESVTILGPDFFKPDPMEKPVPVKRVKVKARGMKRKPQAELAFVSPERIDAAIGKLESSLHLQSENNHAFTSARLDRVEMELAALKALFSDRLIGLTAVLKNLADRQAHFSIMQEKVAEHLNGVQQQLNAIDNDVQTLLEGMSPYSKVASSATGRPFPATEAPVSLGDILGSVQERPEPKQAAPVASLKAGDLGLRTVNSPPPKPMPKIPIPKPPEATQKMEYVGDISAMADALVFDDNKLTQ